MRRRHNNGAGSGQGRRQHGHKFPRPQGDDGASGNRPRNMRNVGAAREKYMNMGRDALHSGDRVLAEYYFQHADHYFRIMMEEGIPARPQQQQQGRPANSEVGHEAGQVVEEETSSAPSALPSFITAPVKMAAAAPEHDTSGGE